MLWSAASTRTTKGNQIKQRQRNHITRTMPPPPTLNVTALAEGSVEAKLLSFVHRFDEVTGAPNWAQSSRLIGFVTMGVLFVIHKTIGTKYDANWKSLIHSIIVGFMSAVAVWLNVFAAVPLAGTTEPLGAILCQGPLTTFHSIVPAITMGYGFFDIMEGIHLAKADFVRSAEFVANPAWDVLGRHGGRDPYACFASSLLKCILPNPTLTPIYFALVRSIFSMLYQIMHGIATTSVMAYFCEYGVPEIILSMLLMEVSSIFCGPSGFRFVFLWGFWRTPLYHISKYWMLYKYILHFGVVPGTAQISTVHLVFLGTKELLSPTLAMFNILCFVITFTAFRMIICPYLWWEIFVTTWEHRYNPVSQACLPWHFSYVSFFFGELVCPVMI